LAERLGAPRALRVDAGPIHLDLSGLGGGRRLRQRYLKAFGSAQRRLTLAHAYFLPDAKIARALRIAAERGVEVKLLLAGRSDVPFARAATLRLYRSFLLSGVRIFEWHQSVLHAKAALVDNHRFLVGSFNLDPLSLANLEALVEIDDPATGAAAEAWLSSKLAGAREVRIEDCRRGFFQRWIGDAVGLFIARLAEGLARFIAFRRLPPFGEAGEGAQVDAGVPRLGVRTRRALKERASSP
jgi:cardiolipin synthase